jgi:hypothetical protein
MCPLSALASNMPGWVCPQHKSSSILTHQNVLCQYDGTWQKQTANPSDCEFIAESNCHLPSNNCWNTPSHNCGNWCTCWNYQSSGGGVTSRLGSGLLGAAKTPAQIPWGGPERATLGHSSGSAECPWWLPSAYNQRTGGYQISCNENKGTFCRYPNAGMNFVCTGYNGVWQLQGQAPTPIPTPTPTPAPGRKCPGWWWIWGGFTPCYREGHICRYPEHQVNYVCSHGTWEEQGNAPTPPPTQAPVQNPASCPDDEHWLRRGNYCSTPNQKCTYPNGVTWLCTKNGVWTDYRYAQN